MEDRLREQLEQILEQSEVEERSQTLMRAALAVSIAGEDGPWLRSMFQLAAKSLGLAYGSKKEANRVLPWFLFSLGAAYNEGNRG